MRVEGSVHCDLVLEPNDYFFVCEDEDNLQIIVTDRRRRPMKIQNVSRRQLIGLISQYQKVCLRQDEARVNEAVQPREQDGPRMALPLIVD